MDKKFHILEIYELWNFLILLAKCPIELPFDEIFQHPDILFS